MVAAGYRAVEAKASRFYLAERMHGHNVCSNEDSFWWDIAGGVPGNHSNPLLLGGRMVRFYSLSFPPGVNLFQREIIVSNCKLRVVSVVLDRRVLVLPSRGGPRGVSVS